MKQKELEAKIKERLAEAEDKNLFGKIQDVCLYLGAHTDKGWLDGGVKIAHDIYFLNRDGLNLTYEKTEWLDITAASVVYAGQEVFRLMRESDVNSKFTGYIPDNEWEAKIEELYTEVKIRKQQTEMFEKKKSEIAIKDMAKRFGL